MSTLTQEEFKKALPDRLKKNVTSAMVTEINQKLDDPEMREIFRENMLSYGHVLRDGKFKLASYVDAVKYVSYKMGGHTNIDAFALVFPDKIQNWTQQGVAPKDMASYVAAYNKRKLVQLIYEQSLIPIHILNRDNYQRAINKQVQLMERGKSERIQCDAANSLLNHLKPPEMPKVELSLGDEKDSTIEGLKTAMATLVAMQRQSLQAGVVNVVDTARQPIVINPAEQQPAQD